MLYCFSFPQVKINLDPWLHLPKHCHSWLSSWFWKLCHFLALTPGNVFGRGVINHPRLTPNHGERPWFGFWWSFASFPLRFAVESPSPSRVGHHSTQGLSDTLSLIQAKPQQKQAVLNPRFWTVRTGHCRKQRFHPSQKVEGGGVRRVVFN